MADTGPIVSALNRGEGQRHRFAAELLGRLGRNLIVPWPVFVEVDLLLRARGYSTQALQFERYVHDGVHKLVAPTNKELDLALELGARYVDSGADLPDLTVMAVAAERAAAILTWDYRHFRAVVLERDHRWNLVVEEHELPTTT